MPDTMSNRHDASAILCNRLDLEAEAMFINIDDKVKLVIRNPIGETAFHHISSKSMRLC
jgi:hypothetical protein